MSADPVQAVAEALIDHTRLRPPSGACSCGHEVPLGHSFAIHQAEAAVAAARPAIEREAKVAGLEDAADELEALVDEQHPDALNPDQWLRDRAYRIEADQ